MRFTTLKKSTKIFKNFVNQYNPHSAPIPIPPEVRNYVFQRDKYQCQSCGKISQETHLSIDHIIPLSRGGKNDISNLQTLCLTCNQQKTDKIDNRFRRYFDT
jgi:5-methylcytosine-specific restriction enzyme A